MGSGIRQRASFHAAFVTCSTKSEVVFILQSDKNLHGYGGLGMRLGFMLIGSIIAIHDQYSLNANFSD